MPKELVREAAVSAKEKSREASHTAEDEQDTSQESPEGYASRKVASAEKTAATNAGAAITAGRKKLEKELGRNIQKKIQKEETKWADNKAAQKADKIPELTKENRPQDKIKTRPERGAKIKEAGMETERKGRLKRAHYANGSAFKGERMKNR